MRAIAVIYTPQQLHGNFVDVIPLCLIRVHKGVVSTIICEAAISFGTFPREHVQNTTP